MVSDIGWIFSRFDLSRWVEDVVYTERVAALRMEGRVPSLAERAAAALAETKDILRSVWVWVLARLNAEPIGVRSGRTR